MKIILSSIDPALADAFRLQCSHIENVSIHEGSILDLECDAIVSPANSFGFMDGGIDALYVNHFGSVLQDRVRMSILRHHHGELLVGTAEIVETDQTKIPYLIAAPTMRVPMALDPKTINPYLAARAVILLVQEGQFREGMRKGEPIRQHVRTIVFPGLGTGVGRVPAMQSAHQIKSAILKHRGVRHSLPLSWADASHEHQLLYTDNPERLQS